LLSEHRMFLSRLRFGVAIAAFSALAAACARAPAPQAAPPANAAKNAQPSKSPTLFQVDVVALSQDRTIVVAGRLRHTRVVLKQHQSSPQTEQLRIAVFEPTSPPEVRVFRPVARAEASLFASLLKLELDEGRFDEKAQKLVSTMIASLKARVNAGDQPDDETSDEPLQALNL
jgi:hypothetical protein